MATYKAQLRVQRRCHSKDIHTFVEALQCLADMAWPFMDGQAKEELEVDQFLLGMDNHELSMQVAAHGHRRTDVLRLARSLEAVHEEERHASCPQKPATQARFVNNGPHDTTDTERVVQEVLAQLTVLPWKDGLAIETNARSVINAKGSGILPEFVLQMGTTV